MWSMKKMRWKLKWEMGKQYQVPGCLDELPLSTVKYPAWDPDPDPDTEPDLDTFIFWQRTEIYSAVRS